MRPAPQAALDLIKQFEGYHDGDRRTPLIEPQRDPVGIYTVGWGYALFHRGQPVRDPALAERICAERWPQGLDAAGAERLLRQIADDVCGQVQSLLAGILLADHELAALTSLAYNIGVGEDGGKVDFADSTVRRKLLAGDKLAAANGFLLWTKADGRVLDGLVRRRAGERALFLGIAAAPTDLPADPVMALQTALNRAGATPPLVTDGRHGPATASALRAWQRRHGLEPTGQDTPETRQALGLSS